MKQFITLITIVIIGLIIAIVTEAGKISGSNKSVLSKMNIEDSLIVKNIKINTTEPMKDEIPEDNIIFDDSFEKTVIDYDKISGSYEVPEKKETKKPNALSLLKQLQKDDKRWHISYYRIRRNDNLWKIAKKFRVSHRAIIISNNITDPDMLKMGKRIKVPNRRGFYYRVKRGDTLSQIAKKYRTSMRKIRIHNTLKSSYLYVGKRIFLPDAKRRRSYYYSRKRRHYGRSRYTYRKRIPGIRLIWPMRGRITSTFGTRRSPFNRKWQFHCGIDISAVQGTPIRAAASGRVIYSGWKPGYGRVVILKHKQGYITVYAHNWKNKVRLNQWVRQGRIIALSGNTGVTTGAHLHFELRKYVTPLNPMRFIR